MFGAGWTEMLIIGIVALVVIGPKDLPVVMRKIGRVVGTVRRMGSEFQRELNKTTGLDQITDLKRSLTEPLRQTSEEIAREFNKVTATGVEPTGIVKPADPKVESVYEQIAATSGVAPPVMKPLASSEPSPAPAEAAVPAAAKPKRIAKPKAVADIAPAAPAKKPAARKTAAKTPKPAELAPVAAEIAANKPRVRSTAKTAAAVAPTATAVAAKPVRSRAKKA